MRERGDQWYSTEAGAGNIICPFFYAHSRRDIWCEGIIKGTRIGQRWKSEAARKRYEGKYCEKRCDSCGLYRVLMQKYEEGNTK